MPSAEIIAIGTELLLGEILDTNTQYIARTLRELGINIYRTTIVGDNKDRITAIVCEATQRSDIIITTGGLGPTVDDPTRAALAQAAGVELEFHPELWEALTARFERIGRKAGENQKRQAYIPQNSIVVENPVGTAPAFIIQTKNNVIISMPGVPSEMKTILDQSIIPFLQQQYHLDETIKIRVLHTSGAGEGWIDEKISDLELLANPTVGLAAHYGIVDIRISAKAQNEEAAYDLIHAIEVEVRDRLGLHIFGSDIEKLENMPMDLVTQCGWDVFCIEAGTNGCLNHILSSTRSSSYLQSKELSTDQVSNGSILDVIDQYKEMADVIIGLSVIMKDHDSLINLALITPEEKYSHQVIFTGHHQNAPTLAVNLALDRLRRIAHNSLEARINLKLRE
jgi:nicotinamide-nucleotide amidase